MTATCVAILGQIETELSQARNVSRVLDNQLSNVTDIFVKAQDEYDKAKKSVDSSRAASAEAALKRAQSEWDAARTRSNDGREEVKRLKLVLVNAKIGCEPGYVAPFQNMQILILQAVLRILRITVKICWGIT